MTLMIASSIIRASYCFTYDFFSEFKLDEIHFVHLLCILYYIRLSKDCVNIYDDKTKSIVSDRFSLEMFMVCNRSILYNS